MRFVNGDTCVGICSTLVYPKPVRVYEVDGAYGGIASGIGSSGGLWAVVVSSHVLVLVILSSYVLYWCILLYGGLEVYFG